MLNSRLVPWLAGILLVVGFGYGLLHLFSLRFEQGDVYPQYSSLRADPLGTKALYDAFNSTGALQTQRNYRPLQRLQPAEPVALFYIGITQSSFWGNSELQHFERLIGSGSRAVFAFAPQQPVNAPKQKKEKAENEAAESKKDEEKKQTGEARKDKAEEKPKDGKEKDKQDKKDEDPETSGLVSFDSAAERWGVEITRAMKAEEKPRRSTKRDEDAAESAQIGAVLANAELPLEAEFPYRSAIYFKDLQPAWRVLYRVAGQPVVIERHWGDGTIVMIGDPFFLSNEALRDEPRPKLLSWLVGPATTIVFDEEHHGIRENTGIAALARKYRLQGAIIALLIVIALAIWRSAIPFVRLASEEDDERVEGRDAAEAFTSLLRRSVAPARILDVCLYEWRRSFSRAPNDVAAVDAVLNEENARPARERHPVRTYRRISEALAQAPHHRRARRTPHSPNAT